MNLGELIHALREEGDKTNNYYGIETNVQSVSELLGPDYLHNYKVEVQLKPKVLILDLLDDMAENASRDMYPDNDFDNAARRNGFYQGFKAGYRAVTKVE